MERIKLKSLSGLTKILGITLCLAGIVTIAFYEGPSLASPNHLQLGHGVNGSAQHPQAHSTGTWIKGCFLLMVSSAAWALWLIMQGKVMEEYPSKIIFTALQCLFSAIQSFFVALSFERHISGWKLGLDIGLFAIAYCGFVVTGISFYLQAWCIEKKGPVFLALFFPLSFVITVFISFFLLGEVVTLGSVLGGLLMVGGLYGVLWAKKREKQMRRNVRDELPAVQAAQGDPTG